jgi:hypothetical protein
MLPRNSTSLLCKIHVIFIIWNLNALFLEVFPKTFIDVVLVFQNLGKNENIINETNYKITQVLVKNIIH